MLYPVPTLPPSCFVSYVQGWGVVTNSHPEWVASYLEVPPFTHTCLNLQGCFKASFGDNPSPLS